jgi:hypothetical protein
MRTLKVAVVVGGGGGGWLGETKMLPVEKKRSVGKRRQRGKKISKERGLEWWKKCSVV